MKALFLTSTTDDYISSVVWDGLQEVLGWENVAEAGFCPVLHDYTNHGSAAWRISGHREGCCIDPNAGRIYDLLVINAATFREHDWHHPINMRLAFCKDSAKVVLVEGGDDWNDIQTLRMPVNAVFRREIHPTHAYPYECKHLSFAAPERWLEGSGSDDRRYDVLAVNSYHSHPVRWEYLPWIWKTSQKHTSIACSGALTEDRWFDYLRASKIAICCPGGGGSDSVRFAEVAACGAIPIFCGVPPKIRDPWFTEEHARFVDTPDRLPDAIDQLLSSDLSAMRRSLLYHVRKHHTTKARAETILKTVGLMQ